LLCRAAWRAFLRQSYICHGCTPYNRATAFTVVSFFSEARTISSRSSSDHCLPFVSAGCGLLSAGVNAFISKACRNAALVRQTVLAVRLRKTDEMIKMMDLLRTQYRDCRTIYLSWDGASWHVSKRLFAEIAKRNVEAVRLRYPIVQTAPLPAGSQFLNIIESVFSGMSRAIIHNSDYPSLDAAQHAIDNYFANRNDSFRRQPKRAGGKIWGAERVVTEFSEANNCKDPLYR
jgi:hypothetical protein